MFSTAPPGYPNTVSTPRSSSALTNISAPVIFMPFPLPDHGPGARRAHQPGAPPVGDESRPGSQPHPHDARRGREHLVHSRPPFRPLVADPHDHARADP